MLLNSSSRILVVAAHPDDEILGCGGTLCRAIDCGAIIKILFLGEGVSARFPIGQYDSAQFRHDTKKREIGAAQALNRLGVSDYIFGTRYCTQFDTVPLRSIVVEIEDIIGQFNPTIVLTHNPSEVNIDHRITYEATEIACRPTRQNGPTGIYAFEIVCSGSWKFDPFFKPNVFVDINDVWQRKLDAWHCYEGEARPFPFPRSDQGLDTLAKMRGMTAGLIRAEAFQLLRKIV